MEIEVLTKWIEYEPIKYLIIGTSILGLMKCIKLLAICYLQKEQDTE